MERTENCRRNLEAIISSYDKVYLFGAGYWAREVLRFIGLSDVQRIFAGIVVSQTDGNPKALAQIPVCSVHDIKDRDKVLLIVAVQDNEALLEELEEMGYVNIITYDRLGFIFDENDLRRDREVARYRESFKTPLFKYIEIETINRCNGSCSFCPVNCNEEQREYHKMSSELFNRIIDQLAELDYEGCVALFSNNEPFLDERIGEFAKYAREKLPKAFIYIYTNGTLLTLEKFREIIPYLDKLHFDNYSTNSRPRNYLEIEEECWKTGMIEKLHYCEIDKNLVRSSRGGNAPNKHNFLTIENGCPLPFVQMVIRPDGKVSLCCNDALGHNTLGDVNENSLVDIWEGELYRECRKKIAKGRYYINTCRYCDYVDERELWENGKH